MKRSRTHTDDGLPRATADWTAEDWRDLHEAIEQAKARIAARHRPKDTPEDRPMANDADDYADASWLDDHGATWVEADCMALKVGPFELIFPIDRNTAAESMSLLWEYTGAKPKASLTYALTDNPTKGDVMRLCAALFCPLKLKCRRCDGTGRAIGSDRPFESSGPGTYPGPCPVCKGTKVEPGQP